MCGKYIFENCFFGMASKKRWIWNLGSECWLGSILAKGSFRSAGGSLEQWTCQTASTEWKLNLYTFEIHTKVPHDCFDNYFLFFYEDYDCQGMLPLLRQSDIFKQREAAMQLSIYTIRFTISWFFSTCPFLLTVKVGLHRCSRCGMWRGPRLQRWWMSTWLGWAF